RQYASERSVSRRMRQAAPVIFGVGAEGAQTMARVFAEQSALIALSADLENQHRNLPALFNDQIRDGVERPFARQPRQVGQAAFFVAFVSPGFDIADEDRVPTRGADQIVRPAVFAPRRPRRPFSFEVAFDSPAGLWVFQPLDEPAHAA